MNFEGKKSVYLLVGLPALIIGLLVGVYFGRGGTTFSRLPSEVSSVSNSQFATFWKAWEVLDQKYVNASSTDTQTKIYGSIKGLAASYGDPYTVFFPPVESKMFKDDISGNFEGVGMEIGIKDKQLQVVAPIKNSPADLAGVKSGDYILSINGTSTSDMSVDAAVKLIRGPKGTSVKIMFLTTGASKPVEKTITRDIINIPTLETTPRGDGIFIVRLYSFTANSADLFRNALREFIISGDHKLVLDLRGNPGGYLDAAWDMASWFLPPGKVVVTEDFGKNGPPNIYRSKGYNIFNSGLQMVILVDGGSASASEILAGALHEQGVAKLVGTKTFGKGSVQELVPLTSDTSLKVTIARWLTPQGHNLSHDGLEPDFKVEVTDKDIAKKADPQLEKAVQLLKQLP
jgi:carboxyl-terminal processing protease